MSPLSSLGTFLTLSFLLPGIIIFSAIVLLFPESYILIEKRSTVELGALVLVISFLNGHLAFLFEIYVLNRFWHRMLPSFNLIARSSIMQERSAILARAEANSVSHLHFDVIFGEFVLFTNTAFWLLLIGFAKLCLSKNLVSFIKSAIVIAASIVILTFTSPYFKHQYLSALEVVKIVTDLREARAEKQALENDKIKKF